MFHLTARHARLALSASLSLTALALAAGQSFAQSAAGDSANEIVVTGTSIRGVKAVGSQTVTLGQEAIEQTGLTSLTEVLKTLPQIQNLGYGEANTASSQGSGNDARGTTINLRGIGQSATLVLVDGHRVASGGSVGSFTDAAILPLAAVDRVEVVLDGVSAVYGSNAISGVVNYVLKKNFNGVSASARVAANKYYNQWGASLTAGRSWGSGNAILTYDHDKRDHMIQGKSPYMRADLTQFGGLDSRFIAQGNTAGSPGIPGNIIVTTAGVTTYYGLPPGTNGVGLTAASLRANQPNFYDQTYNQDYLPETTRDQIALYANQELNENVSVYFEGLFNHRESSALVSIPNGASANISIPASSPFYIAGVPGVAPGAAITANFNYLRDLQTSRDTDSENGSYTLGLKTKLPADWSGEVYGTLAMDRTCGVCGYGFVVTSLNPGLPEITSTLATEIAAGRFNPLSSFPTAQSELDRFIAVQKQQSHAIRKDVVAKVDGPIFSLPGGSVRVALGGEYLWENNVLNWNIRNTRTRLDHDMRAAFGEMYVPVIGEANKLPLIQRLDLSVALRYEDYSDFGSTTNPKVGFTWGVNDELTFRGTYGTSFRAPTLIERDPGVITLAGVILANNAAGVAAIPPDVAGGTQTTAFRIGGSNSDLKPETSRNYSFTADYNPSWLSGLTLNASYYDIKYDNQIILLVPVAGNFLASPVNYATYGPFVTVAPQPATCVNGVPSTYNPVYNVVTSRPEYLAPAAPINACNARVLIDARNQNAASLYQTGIDLSANYRFDTSLGTWNLGGSLSKTLHARQKLSPTAGAVEARDRINYPVSLRWRAAAGWRKEGLGLNLIANYIGSYVNDLPLTIGGVRQPNAEVPSWTTFDATATYEFDEAQQLLKGTKLSLSVQNIGDKDPPTVLSTNNALGGLWAYDNQNHNVFGRTWRFEVTKDF